MKFNVVFQCKKMREREKRDRYKIKRENPVYKVRVTVKFDYTLTFLLLLTFL